jgi:hypothetical protein
VSGPGTHAGALLDILTRIEELLADGEGRYRVEPPTRLSLQRLWICAGEAAQRYGAASGIDDGIEPWAEVRRLRELPRSPFARRDRRCPSMGRNRCVDQRQPCRAACHELSR